MFHIDLSKEVQARSIPIMAAVNSGDIKKVKQLVRAGADINIHAPGAGKTPLHVSIEHNQENIAFMQIDKKADVNAVTKNLTTPLHVAAQTGNVAIIGKLLAAGAKIDAVSAVGCTALHEAAAKGNEDAVLVLIKRKANLNIKDSRYQLTAAQLAACYNHKKIADILETTQKLRENKEEKASASVSDIKQTGKTTTDDKKVADSNTCFSIKQLDMQPKLSTTASSSSFWSQSTQVSFLSSTSASSVAVISSTASCLTDSSSKI